MDNQPKEVAVFKTYTKYNKLKVLGMAIGIIVLAFVLLYFPIKTLFTYTVTYHLNGGVVYANDGKSKKPDDEDKNSKNSDIIKGKYAFLQRVVEPTGIKKFGVGEDGEEIGYYIDYWSKDKNLGSVYTFGTKIWSSFDLYIKWELGVAVRLHFADGEENSDMSTQQLKEYYEQYIEPGSDYTLPEMFNNKVDSTSIHYGEQLIWYDNPECEGEPFFTKTYENLQESVDIYGKWIDTSEDKFVIQNGTLIKYLGYCNKVIIPSGVTKIKDIVPSEFKQGNGDTIYDQDGASYSVWANVHGSTNSSKDLKVVYINAEMEDIGDCAFRDCKSLEKVVFLGSNVLTIGEHAFAGCDALEEFSMPSQVQVISNRAFDGAFSRNANITLNLDNVYRIEDYAFINSKIYGVSLKNISFVGKNAFASCMNLHRFEIKSTNVPTSNVNTSTDTTTGNKESIFYFVNLAMNGTLQIVVPTGKKSEYMNYPYWSMYSSVIVEEDI